VAEASAEALVVSLSNVGDAVLTTPVLEALHRHQPAWRVDILCDPRSRALFEHCPYRGELIERDKRAGLLAAARQLLALRRRRYTLAVDLRTDGIARLLGAGRCLDKRGAAAEGCHAVQRHASVLRPLLGAAAAIPPPRLWLSEAEQAWAAAALAPLPGKRILALAPGANWPGKIWPAGHYAGLANALADRFDGLVLLGDGRDRAHGEAVQARLELPCLSLMGATSLLQAGAVIAAAGAFVGNDSGLGHMAAALGRPVLTLFGPGNPARYRPWGPHADWLRAADRRLASIPAATAAARLRLLLARCGD